MLQLDNLDGRVRQLMLDELASVGPSGKTEPVLSV